MNISEVSEAVRAALCLLGYDMTKLTFTVYAIAPGRYLVRSGKTYIGIYDAERKTFVD